MKRYMLVMGVCLLSFMSMRANAEWVPGQALPGTNETVFCMTTWDPDGSGPSPELLVVGGWFDRAGGEYCAHIATWDGSQFQPLGDGFGGVYGQNVNAVISYGGQLYASGDFDYSGGTAVQGVARWDGSQWVQVGSELTSAGSMAAYDGHLVASATYYDGITETNRVVMWNGSSWVPMGGEFDATPTLIVYGGHLIAAGSFDYLDETKVGHIVFWNGSGWQQLGGGLDSVVYSMIVWDGKLIIGGAFWDGGTDCHYITQWDGTGYSAVGGGTNYWVTALATHDGDLYAAGDFTVAGTADCNYIAKWDGSEWSPLGAGLSRTSELQHVFSLCSYNGGLFEGGSGHYAGGIAAGNIARWQGGRWHGLGNGAEGSVDALIADGSDLYLGGNFPRIGGMPCNYIARWDGSSLNALGDGLPSAAKSLEKYNGNIIAGCTEWFTTHIYSWNGSQWNTVEGDLVFNGFMFPEAVVHSMLVHNGSLVVGGQFSTANGIDCNNIASWNGSGWQAMGPGFTSRVRTLAEFDGQVVAGGDFTTADCNYIARWDGSQWRPLGEGVDGQVYATAVYGGRLIVAGYFAYAGDVYCNGLAAWDGSTWSAMPDLGIEYSGVMSLAVNNGRLYIGGSFATKDTMLWHVAVLDGDGWARLDDGTDSTVTTMAGYGGQLAVGGYFSTAGGEPAEGWARWKQPVPVCGDWGFLDGDVNGDCTVDFLDFAQMADGWVSNWDDIRILTQDWLKCTEPYGDGCERMIVR
jgi:trimeric autotransporter adhesin